MKRLVLIAFAGLFAAGCPTPGPGPLDNSVVIDNMAEDYRVIEVAIQESGTGEERENLIEDPIEPGFSQGFCCYPDGTYDVVAVIEHTLTGLLDEEAWFNEAFVGPMSHVFEIYRAPDPAGD